MNFEAEVIQVSDYAVDGDSSYYYYGDSNPNVSSYNFTAKITDDTVQVSVGDWVDIQLEQQHPAVTGRFFRPLTDLLGDIEPAVAR